MSDSKKRKDTSIAVEAAQTSESSRPQPDDESDLRRQLAAMRAQRDESQAALAAAQAEVEHLRAAACPRCHFHADWTVRVRTMAGQVHSVACPDGPATLIAHVKKQLAPLDPKWMIREQLALVLPFEASSSSSDADVMDPALADDRTLASCGVSKGDLLELLVVDMEWSAHSRVIIEHIKHGGKEVCFEAGMPIDDDDGSLALSWAVINGVCSSIYSESGHHKSMCMNMIKRF
jgi:hypothetical protein